MESRRQLAKAITNERSLGVTFSVKLCNEYEVVWQDCLYALIQLGVTRFRIMSYWDLHEPTRGQVDYSLLDAQLDIIEQAGAKVSLCIGIRQPRWPETHLPDWAVHLSQTEREEAYMTYHQAVIERYRTRTCIESWQLENEFWNKGFGLNNDFSRSRLIREHTMLRTLDPTRPIIMSLANTFGYPLRSPKADIYATTIYLTQYKNERYKKTKYPSWYFAFRRWLLWLITRCELIIHELQAEPWGPRSNESLTDLEQYKSMSPRQLQENILYARRTGISYMDLWGAEWWYWRWKTRDDEELWNAVKSIFNS